MELPRPIKRLTWTGVGSSLKVEKGEIALQKGKVSSSFLLFFQLTLANAGGAPVTLTKAQQRSFLDGLLISLRWGPALQYKPYEKIPGSKLRLCQKVLIGQEVDGY